MIEEFRGILTWYKRFPGASGIYLYAENEQNWDLARVVKVSKHEYGNGEISFMARFEKNKFSYDGEKNVVEMNGIWFPMLVTRLPPPSFL